jgi:hypothetical protein
VNGTGSNVLIRLVMARRFPEDGLNDTREARKNDIRVARGWNSCRNLRGGVQVSLKTHSIFQKTISQ